MTKWNYALGKSKKEWSIITPKRLQLRTRKNGVKVRDIEPYYNPAYGKMAEEASKARKEANQKRTLKDLEKMSDKEFDKKVKDGDIKVNYKEKESSKSVQ